MDNKDCDGVGDAEKPEPAVISSDVPSSDEQSEESVSILFKHTGNRTCTYLQIPLIPSPSYRTLNAGDCSQREASILGAVVRHPSTCGSRRCGHPCDENSTKSSQIVDSATGGGREGKNERAMGRCCRSVGGQPGRSTTYTTHLKEVSTTLLFAPQRSSELMSYGCAFHTFGLNELRDEGASEEIYGNILVRKGMSAEQAQRFM